MPPHMQEKIEDVTPFGCDVYWKPITEQCKSCHDADKAFEQWVKQASSTGGQAVLTGKKSLFGRSRCGGRNS